MNIGIIFSMNALSKLAVRHSPRLVAARLGVGRGRCGRTTCAARRRVQCRGAAATEVIHHVDQIQTQRRKTGPAKHLLTAQR